MTKRRIRLRSVDEVREFEQAADRCDFAVNILNEGALIDAKSIMGVMSLDLTQVLVVTYSDENAELERVLGKFADA
ncbi:MAG: HPr family phosphocarrier protein [Lachnospiraceae bacterium]|nr:HPr family phosphocarrier protein [Lachnospiraceae bacterium]